MCFSALRVLIDRLRRHGSPARSRARALDWPSRDEIDDKFGPFMINRHPTWARLPTILGHFSTIATPKFQQNPQLCTETCSTCWMTSSPKDRPFNGFIHSQLGKQTAADGKTRQNKRQTGLYLSATATAAAAPTLTTPKHIHPLNFLANDSLFPSLRYRTVRAERLACFSHLYLIRTRDKIAVHSFFVRSTRECFVLLNENARDRSEATKNERGEASDKLIWIVAACKSSG